MPSRSRAALAATVVVLLGTGSPALAQGLAGTSFYNQDVQRIASSCDLGGNSWFAYLATGTAEGPFAGPFVEVGVVEVGPPTIVPNPNPGLPPFFVIPGAILAWNAFFAISAPAGQVFGVQSFDRNSSGGLCLVIGTVPETDNAQAVEPYEAVIVSPSGDITFDHGLAATQVTMDFSSSALDESFGAP